MPLRPPFAAVIAVGAVLTGCGSQVAGADPDQPSASATPPESYTYVLTSSCGERGLIGDYDVVVENGNAVSAESRNAGYPYEPDLSEVPTLAHLIAEAASAPPRSVIEYTVDDAGLPESLSLDPVPNGGDDDDECYRVTGLRGNQPGTTTSEPTVATASDLKDVSLGSVIVSVPDTWVSTPNGCHGVLTGEMYLHAPGTLGTKTCGAIPSISVVSTDSALGRALIDYPLNERAINGVRVRVGDTCRATDACVYPFGLLAHLPADNIVLIASTNSTSSMDLVRGVVASIRPSAS